MANQEQLPMQSHTHLTHDRKQAEIRNRGVRRETNRTPQQLYFWKDGITL